MHFLYVFVQSKHLTTVESHYLSLTLGCASQALPPLGAQALSLDAPVAMNSRIPGQSSHHSSVRSVLPLLEDTAMSSPPTRLCFSIGHTLVLPGPQMSASPELPSLISSASTCPGLYPLPPQLKVWGKQIHMTPAGTIPGLLGTGGIPRGRQ